MKAVVGIIDFGLGNLLSVTRAFQKLNLEVLLIEDAVIPESVTHIVLPGVGAFREAMDNLKERGQDVLLMEWAASDRPLLGICLGAQLLLEKSYEFGECEGLGLVEGEVRLIDGSNCRVPNVGWRRLTSLAAESEIAKPLLEAGEDFWAYFVHSFQLCPSDRQDACGWIRYGDFEICAAIGRGKVLGVQFHPEKSGSSGLNLLSSFASLV